MDKKTNTASRLKEIMAERGYKQIDILNLSKPYCKKFNTKLNKNDLSQYISGKVEPGQKKLMILAESLNVSPAWLMGLDVAKTPDERRQNTMDIIMEAFPFLENPINLNNCTYLSIYIPKFKDDNIKINTADDIIYEKFAFEIAIYSIALEKGLLEDNEFLTYEQIEKIKMFFKENIESLRSEVNERKLENFNKITKTKQKLNSYNKTKTIINDENFSELDKLLFSKAKMLNDDEKKAILSVIDAMHKDIDKELDN